MRQSSILHKLLTPTLFCVWVLLSTNLSAQKYAVYFKDKDNSPYSIDNPEAFLSQRSLDRRARHGIEITAQDLPVNPQYVQQVKNLGAKTPFTSKWLNCVLVSCSPTIINQIENLPFVSHCVYVAPDSYSGKSGEGTVVSKFSNKLEKEEDFKLINPADIREQYGYGQGYEQIHQINGIPVHEQGFTGEGVLIAVLDAGFQNANALSVFSSIYDEERMVFELDVVKPGGNIYASNTSNHGTHVLSCMSANANNQFVGTAPKASFALIRTEDSYSEYLIECYNWVVGAEAADSIGADIINTSLGYFEFDDYSMDFTYSQMDGESIVSSFAAKTAIEKGIFVTVSMGNNNYTSWPWMGSPGDATYAGTIGAVDYAGIIAFFSSLGPNGAGTPKPNVLARGVDATVYSTSGNISSADGTSFSSPISCGMYACLIQANPNIHPALLRDIVDETGDRYPNYDITYGYGIPNYAAALETVLSLIPDPPPLDKPRYAVHFKDKNNSTYSITEPLVYLSQRALDRRDKYGISITEDDLPPNIDYVEKVSKTGAYVSDKSRWANAVLVYADSTMLEAIKKLDCVEKTVYVKPAVETSKQFAIHNKWKDEVLTPIQETRADYDYGFAYGQIHQLNGIPVHKQGFAGEGVIIAVLDAGFNNADKVTGLSNLFNSGRIVLERNIPEPQRSLYDPNINNHGTMVLSCMGGELPGDFVGTAPQASYALIRTEESDNYEENLIEEYFWLLGAELADSLGADILNSSLSYSTFDDPVMDHVYSDMDGNTAISSIAAKMAVERGIFACISAGNSNGTDWPWVGTPADVPQALTLGAVNLNGQIASFSSIGPNGAGDPKPDVVACGYGAAVITPENDIVGASGTSFSSPITCGMVACIIGATPLRKPSEIHLAIQQSANRYPTHNIQYGYGIPNFWKVLNTLSVNSDDNKNNSKLIYYPNPTTGVLNLVQECITNFNLQISNIEIFDIYGKMLKNIPVGAQQTTINLKEIGSGIVFLKVIFDDQSVEMVKCVVSNH